MYLDSRYLLLLNCVLVCVEYELGDCGKYGNYSFCRGGGFGGWGKIRN